MSWPITAKQAKEMSTSWISSGQWINQQEITYIYMHWKTWNILVLSFFFYVATPNFMIFEFYEQNFLEQFSLHFGEANFSDWSLC